MKKTSWYFKTAFLMVTILSLCSCITTDYSRINATSSMEIADDFIKKGDYYSAVGNALDSYGYKQEESTSNFIKLNHERGLEQGVQYLKTYKVSADDFNLFLAAVDDFVSVQNRLKQYKFISQDRVDVNLIYQDYGKTLIKELSDKNDIAGLDKFIMTCKQSNLGVNDVTIDLINKVSLSYASQGKIFELAEFYKNNKNFIKDETKKEIYEKLYDHATSSESLKQMKKALDAYSFIYELDRNNNKVAEKIKAIKSELLTMLIVLEPDNSTDELIKINYESYMNDIKSNVENTNKLLEVVLQDDGINKLRSVCLDFNYCYDYLKKQKDIGDIQFSNKIRFIVATKIINMKINRQPRFVSKKTETWNFASTSEAIQAGLASYSAYGGGKLTHFEYDECTERVSAKIIVNVLIYDRILRKVVNEDRIQLDAQDEITWAENPMAVGVRNKVPASTSAMPTALRALMTRNKFTKTDGDIINELLTKLTAAVVEKININLLK